VLLLIGGLVLTGHSFSASEYNISLPHLLAVWTFILRELLSQSLVSSPVHFSFLCSAAK